MSVVPPGVLPGGTGGRIEDGCKGTRRFGLYTREDVLICRHREGWGGVAEPFTYDLDWDAGLQQKGGMRVAKVVQAYPGKAGPGDELLEGVGENLGMDRGAVVVREDVAVLICSSASRRSQELDGTGIKVDRRG